MEIRSRENLAEELQEERRERRKFWIRQVLNIIFMVGAIAGAVLYWVLPDEKMGIIVIMTAMFFKMAECIFRVKLK